MPRLPPAVLIKAARVSPHVRALLPATRDVESAVNELRWIREHVDNASGEQGRKLSRGHRAGKGSQAAGVAASMRNNGLEKEVGRLCGQRGKGVPLQYVLGSQPFGDLEIRCRRNVLVPRGETEAWALHLGRLIQEERRKEESFERTAGLHPKTQQDGESALRVVDFCTGTGCIALSLYGSLAGKKPRRPLQVHGIDVSPRAVALARENLAFNVQNRALLPPTAEQKITFERADLFDDKSISALATAATAEGYEDASRWNVLVANPPYISRDVWRHGRGQMGASARKYEPRLALVPLEGPGAPAYEGCRHEDIFYRRLMDIAETLGVGMVVFEVGDQEQAVRVSKMAVEIWREGTKSTKLEHFELWRDWPDLRPAEDEAQRIQIEHGHDPESGGDGGHEIEVKGSGNVRCVVLRLGSDVCI